MFALQVLSVYLTDWVIKGEFHEDTQYYDTIWFVMVDLNDGRTLCHEVSFRDDMEAAQRLAQRVEAAGTINEDHWYFHDFFSRSLESRLMVEAGYEDLARKGLSHMSDNNPWYSEGHA